MTRSILWLKALPNYLFCLGTILGFKLRSIFSSKTNLLLCEITQFGDMFVNLGNYALLSRNYNLFIVSYLDSKFVKRYVPQATVLEVPFKVNLKGWFWPSLTRLLSSSFNTCIVTPIANAGNVHFVKALNISKRYVLDVPEEQYELDHESRKHLDVIASKAEWSKCPHVYDRAVYLYKTALGIDLDREQYHKFYENLRKTPEHHHAIYVPQAGNSYRDVPTEWAPDIKKFLDEAGIEKSTALGVRKFTLPAGMNDRLSQTSFVQACELIRSATVVVGAETSLIHFAHLIGVPTVCISGGGDYGKFIPWAEERDNLKVVTWTDHSCFGCSWSCQFETLDRDPAPCIRNILMDDIHKAITGVLA